MAGRGRGRGRGGFGRGQPFPSNDQLSALAAEKVSSAQSSPYPPTEFKPAPLSTEKEYEDLLHIRDQLLIDFQTSDFYLKHEDENLKLFSSGGEKVATVKPSMNFHWDYFPLELRPIARQRLKKTERKNATDTVDLSWLDTLAANENETAELDAEGNEEEDVVEEEELGEDDTEMDTDYQNAYFDPGDDDRDDNLDEDEDPTY